LNFNSGFGIERNGLSKTTYSDAQKFPIIQTSKFLIEKNPNSLMLKLKL
jgi:hypothetical protein